DCQVVQLRAAHKVGSLLGIGQQLITGHGAFGAVPVFLVAHHGLERAQATQFTFNGHAQLVRDLDHTAGDVDVVFVIGNGLAVFHQGTVHHDAGKAQIDGALADGRRLAVVLVHDHRNLRIGLNCSLDQVLEEAFACVLPSTGGGLHDHGAVGLGRGFHDGLHLFQVVDVERRNTVAVLGGVIQQLAHGN